MKPSPLRLNWVTYPEASYETSDAGETEVDRPVAADIEAQVRYNQSGEHFAFIRVTSRSDDLKKPYKFMIAAVANFSFDIDIAKREYKAAESAGLVPMIAVNVSRILYASVREYLSMITSRATYGSTILDSTLLEPSDVEIDSEMDPPELIEALFGATPDEVQAFRERLASGSGEVRPKVQKAEVGSRKQAPSAS